MEGRLVKGPDFGELIRFINHSELIRRTPVVQVPLDDVSSAGLYCGSENFDRLRH
jgi:hypothetical protein